MTIQAPSQAQVRDAWDTIAPRFDEFVTPENIRHSEQVLGRLDIRHGTRLLDVAAGSGALSIPAARMGASVLATDIAPAMIDRLAARARAEGLTNVDGKVMDGHALELPDDIFDVSVSQHGVSLFPDVHAGLREMVRVTKPGGTVLVITFGSMRNAEFLGWFIGAIKAAVPGFTGPPTDPPPLPFQLADPDVLRGTVTAAGLTGVAVETSTWDMPMRSADHMWSVVTASNPLGAQLVANLTAAQTTEARQVLDGMLRERSAGLAGAVLHTEINIATGTA